MEWEIEFKNYQQNLTNNIKTQRNKLGLSQEKLAFLSGVDRTMVSKIERCLANPSLEMLCKIAHSLDVTVNFLLMKN
jgi:transcriptional regulator with XRE-family HTH domain